MPLPPALAAKLAKRGLIQTSTSAGASRNKDDKPKFVEEVIAESYDDPKGSGGLPNRKTDPSGASKFQRLGHYGCPNKSNPHHTCSPFCVSRWGRGKVNPSPEYNRRRLKMLKKYPLPTAWLEIYDPGTGRYYYWHTETDDVCWTTPKYPNAVIGKAAPDVREQILEDEKIAEASKPKPSDNELMKESLKKLEKKNRKKSYKERGGLDPMDPASYSDVPRGNWSSGLKADSESGVDTTASGPLFQQRPYPSPGDILRANKKK